MQWQVGRCTQPKHTLALTKLGHTVPHLAVQSDFVSKRTERVGLALLLPLWSARAFTSSNTPLHTRYALKIETRLLLQCYVHTTGHQEIHGQGVVLRWRGPHATQQWWFHVSASTSASTCTLYSSYATLIDIFQMTTRNLCVKIRLTFKIRLTWALASRNYWDMRHDSLCRLISIKS